MKLPLEDIYRGGNSKSRNPHMQTMLRMVGFGDNAGSGFPSILATWEEEGWVKPELVEDTKLNQVTLYLRMMPQAVGELEGKSAEKSAETEEATGESAEKSAETEELAEESAEKSAETEELAEESAEKSAETEESTEESTGESAEKSAETEEATGESAETEEATGESAETEESTGESAELAEESAEKSAETEELAEESAEKSAETEEATGESAETEEATEESAEKFVEMQEVLLSERQRQILECMELEVLYKTEEIAEKIGLKGPRTRQLLNELVAMGRLTCTAATKNRRYIRME